MLFDLNSSGGTFVNGQRIDQSILYPGDVVSLAGVTLIFGQDLPAGNNADRGGTEPKPAVSPARTAELKPQPGSGKPKKAGKP
jgi:pSer/pThr/pTyr-binding forkhead associated (FHA) protein